MSKFWRLILVFGLILPFCLKGESDALPKSAPLHDDANILPDNTKPIIYVTTKASYIYDRDTFDRDSIVICENPKFYITVNDTIGCVGDTITLTLVGGTVIAWFNEGSTANTIHTPIFFDGANEFWVEAIDDDGCRGWDTITVYGVAVPRSVQIWAEPDVDTICRGDSILLVVAADGERYEWNVFQYTDSIVVSPRETFTYTVKFFPISSLTHCYSTGRKTIHVKNCDIVYFPSAISLSSPIAANRIFKPIGVPHSFSQYYLAIYNRWGQLIFESRNFDIGWNGTHQGENVRPGTYVFLFRIANKGDVWERVGTVTVID
ncbi:MAG: gliding motility-associated C-terminal domain-containing protein [Bacteroidales bacterium]|nr:gliding motility-associated C-terminal domain-containing protein [Bacteroidales bacterium]